MFTGIVQSCAVIEHIEPREGGLSFVIKALFSDLILGESIAIDGVCLTLSCFSKTSELTFFASSETLSVTQLGQYYVGQSVHLERALRVGDRLGGHWVTGHVDGLVRLCARVAQGECLTLRFVVPSLHERMYLVKKGSITLAGVSLTLNEVDEEGFSVMIVPHTLQTTHLGGLSVGDFCHVEYDYLLKWAAGMRSSMKPSILGEVE